MKKKSFFIFLALIVSMSMVAQQNIDKVVLKSVMKRVVDWQIANPEKIKKHGELDWTNAALYVGMLDWAELTEKEDNDTSYYKWLIRIGEKNGWQMAKRMYHADDIAVGQCFADLYGKYKKERMIVPLLARTEWVVNHPSNGSFLLDYRDGSTLERWTWCDALFMAPPVYIKLYRLTGNRKYLQFMDEEFRATYYFLYDKEESLFYRDYRYFKQREANGQKVFWGRGNGWVLGGLAEMLKDLPKEADNYAFYKDLFVTLATRLAGLQGKDGYWHASLLDPDSYPSPETSATGFIVYALTYGINEGLLDRKQFLPVVMRGWQAMFDAVEPDGKLGYVQPIGADPRKVTRDMTEVYGVGAFLMAGCEIYKLITQ